MEYVYVTNTSEKDHRDHFHGEDYFFPVGRPVKVPEDFAIECLGHGSENKHPFVVRLGWSVTANDMPQAIERLEKFKIARDPAEMNRELPSAVGEVTPFPATGRGRKATARAA